MVICETMQGDEKPGVRSLIYMTALVPQKCDNIDKFPSVEGVSLSFMQPKGDCLYIDSPEATME